MKEWSRRILRGLLRLMGSVAVRSRRTALVVADSIAKVIDLSRGTPSAAGLRQLFPHLSPAEARAARRAMRRSLVRRRLIVTVFHRFGPAALRDWVAWSDDVAALRPPMIVGTFHVGAMNAISPVTERLAGSVFAVHAGRRPLPAAANVRLENVEGHGQRRALLFYEAVRHLEQGEFVAMAMDPDAGGGISVPFLGTTLTLARGAFALSRITGAPIVPIVLRWSGSTILVTVGERIPPQPGLSAPDCERASAQTAARWLEQYLNEHPAEITNRVLTLMGR